MPEDQTPTILAVFTALISGGGVVAAFNAVINKKKMASETILIKANADSTVIGSAMEFVKAIREEAADLRKRAMEQEIRPDALEQKINILEDHIRLQIEIITNLKKALEVYNPEHPLLKEPYPPAPV